MRQIRQAGGSGPPWWFGALATFVCLTAGAPSSARAASVAVSPSDTTVSIGDPFLIRVEADAFSDLKGYELIFEYDPTVLELVGSQDGDVLAGTSYFATLLDDDAAPEDSAWYNAAVLVGSTQAPGVLVHYVFRGIEVGESLLECRRVDFRNSQNQQTIPACSGGRVVVTSVVPAAERTWGRVKALYR